MSALTLCGRKWNMGADDFVIPSLCLTAVNLPLLAVAAFSYVAIGDDSACDDASKRTWVEIYRVGFLAAFAVSSALDLAIMALSLRTKLCVPNTSMPPVLSARAVLALLMTGFTVLGTVLVVPASSTCIGDGDEADDRTRRLNLTIVVVSWVASLFFWSYAACRVSGAGALSSTDVWDRRFRFWMCTRCWRGRVLHEDGEGEREEPAELFDGIARVLATAMNVRGLVPSDVTTGLALVKAVQIGEVAAGRKTFFVEDRDRPSADVEPRRAAARPPGGDDVGLLVCDDAAGGASPAGEAGPAPRPGDVLAGRGAAAAAASARGESASLAALGVQPALSDDEWARVAEARELARFASAAYGWPLYGMVHLPQWACCCLCSPCMGLEPGTAYEGRTCCNASVAAFLRTAGVRREDLLVANLVSVVGYTVYYVCADRERRRLVVTVRGTLSLHDVVTDLDAGASPFAESDVPGATVHTGIYRNARGVYRDLRRRGVLRAFLDEHPGYALRVVGHSLGAGIAGVLAVMLQADFPGARGVAFAPPHLFSEALARHESTRRVLTSVVHSKDVVPRLSLESITRLKYQMRDAYGRAALDTKAAIMWNNYRRRYARVVDLEAATQYRSGDGAGAADAERRAHDDAELDETAEAIESMRVSGGGGKADEEDSALAVPENVAWGDMGREPAARTEKHPPLYLPGVILHYVQNRPPPHQRGCCCGLCCSRPSRFTVYPADQSAFREIMVDFMMGFEHLPNVYENALASVDTPPPAAAAAAAAAANE